MRVLSSWEPPPAVVVVVDVERQRRCGGSGVRGLCQSVSFEREAGGSADRTEAAEMNAEITPSSSPTAARLGDSRARALSLGAAGASAALPHPTPTPPPSHTRGGASSGAPPERARAWPTVEPPPPRRGSAPPAFVHRPSHISAGVAPSAARPLGDCVHSSAPAIATTNRGVASPSWSEDTMPSSEARFKVSYKQRCLL